MNKLQLPQAKLFYAVGQAYRKRMIDENQRRLLKQKIITDNVQIFQILEQTDTQSVLLEKLIQLVRAPDNNENHHNEQQEGNGAIKLINSSNGTSNPINLLSSSPSNVNSTIVPNPIPQAPQAPVEQEQASSPWGQFLRRKKFGMKGQQHGDEVKELKSLIKPEKAD